MGETQFSKETAHGRMYEWDKDNFVSVTTAIKYGIAKPELVGWAARTVAKLATQMEQVDYQKLLDAFEEKRSGASSIGNRVHAIADMISRGEDPGEIDEDAQPYVNAFNDFINDVKPEFVESEVFVANRTMFYAGTIDSIVRLDGELYVLDIKTGNNIYPEVGLQLSAYSRAEFIGRKGGTEHEMPKVNQTKGLVLHIRPEKYALYPVMIGDEVFDAFLAALDIYHYDSSLKHYMVGPKLYGSGPKNETEITIGE